MAVVQVNENTLDFIFDESVNNYTLGGGDIIELYINSTKFYYYDENNNLIELPFTYENDVELALEAGNLGDVSVCSFSIGNWLVAKVSNDYNGLIANNWYVLSVLDESVMLKTKGFRIENFTYAEGQTLETINTLVNPYIGTKTSFAKTYTLRVNGKTLNTINGKKIRNLIYKGTTYEIAEPVVAEYSLTFENTSGLKFPSDLELPKSIKAGQTIDINWYTLWKPGPFFKIEGINCNARWFTTTDEFNNNYFHIEVSNATGDAVVKMYDDDLI